MHVELTASKVPGKKPDQWLNFLIPFLSIIITVGVGLIIHYDQKGALPGADKLQNLDAGFYRSIAEHGYQYDPNGPNNTAFFPLFSYVWRWLHVGMPGISIVNGLLFIIGTFVLMHYFPAGWRTRLLYAGLSLLLFYVVPYSEGVFYFFVVALLVGLKKRKPWLVILGILGAGLTRSVGTIFAPAFLLIGLYRWYHTKRFRDAGPYLLYSAASVLSIVLVFSIQWYQTGEFFAFTHTQRYWFSKWQIPQIPFNTWGLEDNHLYDQLALFVCTLCIFGSTLLLSRKTRKPDNLPIEDYTLFSIFYFAGVALLMLFTRGGGFNSIDRYVFATPFLFILLKHLEAIRFRLWHMIAAALLGIAYFLICWHMGNDLPHVLNAGALLLITLLIPVLLQQKNKLATALLLLMSGTFLYIQAQLWFRHISGEWVG